MGLWNEIKDDKGAYWRIGGAHSPIHWMGPKTNPGVLFPFSRRFCRIEHLTRQSGMKSRISKQDTPSATGAVDGWMWWMDVASEFPTRENKELKAASRKPGGQDLSLILVDG